MNEIVFKASEFAFNAHKGQKYGDAPYAIHLSDVYAYLCEYGIQNTNILAAGWFHDVLEDAKITRQDLENEFNMEIAELVYLVTDEPGQDRKERHKKTFPKLKKKYNAIVLKQADRLSNGVLSYFTNKFMFSMYKEEYPEFREILEPCGGLNELWSTLDVVFHYRGVKV